MAEDDKAVMPDGAEHAQWPENLTVPDAPGDVVVPSNVIDGLFEEKRAAAKEAEKQAAGQETPAAGEQPPEKKEARRGRPPKTDKEEKGPDKPEKQKRGGRPPKGDKQAANVGGGVSGKSAGKEETAPAAPESPAPPRDATRPGETEIMNSQASSPSRSIPSPPPP